MTQPKDNIKPKEPRDLLWEMGIWEGLTHDQHIKLEKFFKEAKEEAVIAELKKYMNQRCGCLNCDAIADSLERKIAHAR